MTSYQTMHAKWKDKMELAKLGNQTAKQELKEEYALDQWSVFQVEAFNLLCEGNIHVTSDEVVQIPSIILPTDLNGSLSSFPVRSTVMTDAKVSGCPLLLLQLEKGSKWLAYLGENDKVYPLFNVSTRRAYEY